MIKVLRHGNTISVQNPATGELTEMINVTFIEDGRNGADKGMSDTSAFLSEITGGDNVGLNQQRVHTHPIISNKIGLFPIGKEFPGHINRAMYSMPQIRQQIDKDARMIDGRPTYFKTFISNHPEDDVDMRISTDVLAQVRPNEIFGSRIGATNVRVVENRLEGVQGTISNTDREGQTYGPNAPTQHAGGAAINR